MNGSAPNGARNPYLRANSLPELLSWHDVDFVRCAYVTVLGRSPDLAGEAYYLDRIRRGRSKMEVLLHLRQSAEAIYHDPGIAGFDRALRKAAWARRPFIGRLIRMVSPSLEGNSVLDRHFRATVNSIWQCRATFTGNTDEQYFSTPAVSASGAGTTDLGAINPTDANPVAQVNRTYAAELEKLAIGSPLQRHFLELTR